MQKAELTEIHIFRDDDLIVLASIFPYFPVKGSVKPHFCNMG
jgi:hypothetical protein